MKKILLAPNSFKECSDSTEVANILEKLIDKGKDLKILKLPISDGGDGFLNVCIEYFNLKILTFTAPAPYGNDLIDVRVGYSTNGNIVYIESAEVIGLRRIPVEKRHPLLLNSKGLGVLIQSIIESGLNVDKIIIGIGGTGTSDLGLGLCSVFGLRLFDLYNKEAKIIPENFFSVQEFLWPNINLPFKIELVTDVDNRLLGTEGAVGVFAKQKGATKGETKVLKLGFEKIVKLFINKKLINSANELNGAGGGLAAGLQIFFDAKIIKAKNFINRMLSYKIDEFAPDFVVTGEGAFDEQSIMDKGAKIVIENCVSRNIPVFLVCGKIDKDLLKDLGVKIIPIELQSFFKNQRESIENFQKGLELAGEKIIKHVFSS